MIALAGDARGATGGAMEYAGGDLYPSKGERMEEDYTIDDFISDFLPNDPDAGLDDDWLPSWAQQA